MRLTDVSFAGWFAHVFNHDVRSPEWYFDPDSAYWDGSPDLTVAYLTQLFENPGPYLQPYSNEQLNQGFWYLVSNSGSTHMFALLDEQVPQEARIRCVRAFYPLFEKIFAKFCSPHLSHLDEPGANPLNTVCYMWWDIMPIFGMPDEQARREFDREILAVMERILGIDSPACRESALHGLGHWQIYYPDRVHQIVDHFIAGYPGIRADLLNYAKQARAGCVL